MRRRIAVYSLLLLGSTSFARGVEFSAEYTADMLSVVSGGLSTGSEYLDNLDLELQVDLDEFWRAGTGRLLVRGLYNNGATFSATRAGDLQGVSNIDADGASQLFEFWYELSDADWSIRAGLYDLNSEFDAHETGSIFLNSSHGIGAEIAQTGKNGPSIFPASSLALRAAVNMGPLTARTVILDGEPGRSAGSTSNRTHLGGKEGVLSVSEVDVPYAKSGRLWAGYWRYSAEFEFIDGGGTARGNDGWYVGTETGFQFGTRAAGAFIRYGRADERFNILGGYLGAGAAMAGLFESRPADQLGIAVASARAGDRYRDHVASMGEQASGYETTWELTYRIYVNENIVVQPDIQYVRNPSLSAGRDSVWVAGCRIQLEY